MKYYKIRYYLLSVILVLLIILFTLLFICGLMNAILPEDAVWMEGSIIGASIFFGLFGLIVTSSIYID